MQNKTKTYVLLAVVLGVWGLIGYKIIIGLNPESPEVAKNNFDVSFNPKIKTENDTFSIKPAERDPFLGTLTRKQSKARSKTVNKTVVDTTWVPIVYKGLVKRQNTSQQVFVVNISNTQYLLKRGQTINGVTLVKGTEKQIVVRYKNKQKTFTIQ